MDFDTRPQIKPRWLSPHQLAGLWGVSRRTILRLIADGTLPALKVNQRVVRIAETDAAAAYYCRYGRRAQ